jgi:hypothetical protein
MRVESRGAQAHRSALPAASGWLLALGTAVVQAAAGSAGVLSIAAPPPAGTYDARLCVSTGSAPQHCGPVTVDLGDAGLALVRISDIAYRLEVYGGQLGVTLFHGTMQIDGFFAQYQWNGSLLRFVDQEKNTRYELKLGVRRFGSP